MRFPLFAVILATTILMGPAPAVRAETVTPVNGIAMHGKPKYGAAFRYFDYVNPEAPKGGELRLAAQNTFDNLNPFIVKGIEAAGTNLPFESLLAESADEPFSRYGLIAESLEVPADRSWVIFTIRPQARFHDGSAITPEDIIFSLETLKAKGAPNYRFYYAAVAKAEKIGERRVKFTFKPGDNRELPLIIGEMPILPRHTGRGATSPPPPWSRRWAAAPIASPRRSPAAMWSMSG
jgi:microcin C transport system substrate-binding protein